MYSEIKFSLIILLFFISCSSNFKKMSETKVIFLHHSTGKSVLRGNTSKIAYKLGLNGTVNKWFKKHNRKSAESIDFTDLEFPKKQPYGWKNYPYDYYNIWVQNGGEDYYKEEPTLELLTRRYDVIIWKHCFPVSRIEPDIGQPDIDSERRSVENYKLQYLALRRKMNQFPDTKFIVWTGAALVKNATSEEQAIRAKAFFSWVKEEWDQVNDNIFIWDFYSLEVEDGLYFKEDYADGLKNSHPNQDFAKRVAPLFCEFIVDVVKGEIK